ncbi:COG4315 family predicted lipoprotein [Phytohabitans houttuyneae]|uniref:Lipoprotein n=1 Tax=Phytohabitans houttuyneae TaxID=1076126 RepID=A0A6V8K1F8_9ACTN|nr:hypothetical protein [Phytohabitans houttuyneae]GFJ75999.1 hypothetical protein Phou_001790 [Phytohabitans houttuyneae]
MNAKGRTIYRFEKDDNSPSRTTCAGECLKTWQPVLAPNGVEVGDGVDEDLVGVIKRPDGSRQVTLRAGRCTTSTRTSASARSPGTA